MLKSFRKSNCLIVHAFQGSDFMTVNNLVFLNSEKLQMSVLMLVSIFGEGRSGVVKNFKKIILE